MKPSLHNLLLVLLLPATLQAQKNEFKHLQPTPADFEKVMVERNVITYEESYPDLIYTDYEDASSRPQPKDAAMQYLQEINQGGSAEAYPWMSEDGLRIYFTHDNVIEQWDRKSLSSKFENKKVIVDDGSSIVGQWLNPTETEIWYTSGSGGALYHGTRKNIKSGFENFEEIKLVTEEENYFGFISGPSLTPDETELYIFYSGDGGDRIDIFNKEGNQYVFSGSVAAPEGDISPGHLTADGLSLYISIQNNGIEHLYVADREKIGDEFENFGELFPDEEISMIQPYAIMGGSMIVFTGSYADSWGNNDLYIWSGDIVEPLVVEEITEPEMIESVPVIEIIQPIAEIPAIDEPVTEEEVIEPEVEVATKEIPVAEEIISSVLVYPNPAVTSARFVTSEEMISGQIAIYDLSGNLIFERNNISSNEFSVDLASVSAGMYIYSISDQHALIGQGQLNVVR